MKLQTGKSTGFSFSLRQVGSPLIEIRGIFLSLHILWQKKQFYLIPNYIIVEY